MAEDIIVTKAINVITYPDGRMDPKNSAIYLGVTEGTLAFWRSKGMGPKFVKRGRVWYFKEDLDAWLAEGRSQSTAQARFFNHRAQMALQEERE